ncbi:MAG: glycosyltransferase family 4 protein [Ardenticatenaceae bacterium]|nr:glycosyltransferase family 4 protein [Anaerolineales bacterium]MCB8922690.1 glycosyltransferase family 4 protein [Ardenticatenaceae bacterium]MCB8991761.1 glycosyltransferase family 4 protein [Ardenticatenaceae bacterium]MCB9003602.1 glycosyltransferase family 4 protein [Ardenticatenaceae bacterium]
MRIGIDVTSAVVQGGGIGRYTRELVRALAQQDSPYEYRFFSAKRPSILPVPNPLPEQDGISYHPAPLNERWLYRLWYRLRLPLPVQLITGRLDLFHSPDFVLPPVSGGIPTLLTVHDLSFAHYPEVFPEPLVRYLNTVVPWSVGRATHILADSQATKDDLTTLWHVPAEKITVLYSGVDPRFRPVESGAVMTAVRQRYQLGDAPYMLAVGTVQPRKNYQMLIRAFAPLAGKFPHNLIIAGGKGWLYDEMMAEVGRQGLDGRVHFIGFVDDDDLPALYSGADLYVFPSLYEGFGLPLLEAMGCGVPVLTSNASSLPEVAGAAAVQLSPHDETAWTTAMAELLGDDTRRVQMVAAGFRQARQFSWGKSAKQLLAIYADLLGSS